LVIKNDDINYLINNEFRTKTSFEAEKSALEAEESEKNEIEAKKQASISTEKVNKFCK